MKKKAGLPDYIQPGLRVLFVGINPGLRSARVGHHFAGYSNRFWKLLSDAGLVPFPVTFLDDCRLPQWGFGLTNIISRPSTGIDSLEPGEYAEGWKRLQAKIRRFRPQIVALLGVTLLKTLLTHSETRQSSKKYSSARFVPGLQTETLAGARLFVLPNPSGRNAHYSYQDMLNVFLSLKGLLVEQAYDNVPKSG